MAAEQEFHFPSTDGSHACYAHVWRPEGAPRGVVQIVHGVAEYIQRYAPFACWLAERGFLVVGEDHLGHGKTASDGLLGYFGPTDGWNTVVRDIRQLRELTGAQNPGLPYFMLGHSMGSFLTRTYLINWPDTLTGAILSGTGQEPAATVTMGRAVCSLLCALRGPDSHSDFVYNLSLGAYNKQFRPNRTSADWICRDERVVDAYLQDPLCTFHPTVGMFRDMMVGLQYIAEPKNLRRMDPNTPIHFFSGDRDPVGQNGAGVQRVAGFFRDAGCTDVSVKLYPGGRHEMLNEINRLEVYQDVLAWLEAKL